MPVGQRILTNSGDIDSLQIPVNIGVTDGTNGYYAQTLKFNGATISYLGEGVVQVDVDGGSGGNLTVGNVTNVGNIQVSSELEVTGSAGNATISVNVSSSTSGQVLTSNGNVSAPTFQDASGGGGGNLTGVTTDEATQLGNLGPPAGNLGPNTVIIGSGAGAAAETSLTGTVIIGANAAPNLTNGSNSTVVGANALSSLTSRGSSTTAVGTSAGSALTSGAGNTFLGADAGDSLISGDFNVFVGIAAGHNLTAGSSNVVVGAGIVAPNTTGSGQTNINNLLTSDGAGNISLRGLPDTDPLIDGSWYLATVGNLTVVAQSQG